MKRRILVLVTALCIVFNTFGGVVASASSVQIYNEESAIVLSKALGIMAGDQNGNMNLDKNVSRAEFAKIAVAMSQYRNMVATTSTTSVFRDCTFKHWAAPYVRVAVTNGIINGYPDGTFKPENTVALEEAVTVMLKLLGYTNDDFGASWPYGQIGIATSEHILDNVSRNIGDKLTRADVLKILYNTLVASPKNSQNSSAKYLEQLDCYLYEDAVIIATSEQNNSVASGYVLTSQGTFKLSNNFDMDYVGRKGDLIIKSGDFAAFMPSVQTVEKHVVYSKLNDTLITYNNGNMTSFTVDSNVTAYQDTNKTTFSSVKNGISTGDTIYLMKDATGSVDYLTVATDNLKGPYTVTSSNWYTKFTSDASSLTVMTNGVKGSYTDVKTNDIVYYLADINTVFAYSRKITGVYEKASPNKDMPTSVTVSGVTYTLESAVAFDKLSSNGSFKFGDTVTLLIGKDGQIADVMDASGAQTEVAGVLLSTGSKEFTNPDGEVYTSLYATLVCADGSTLEVVTNSNYKSYINRVMNVNFNNGVAKLTARRGGSTVSGKVDSENMTIGSTAIDETVSILDIANYGEEDEQVVYISTYMQRLDDIDLNSDVVVYCKKNSEGKVVELILNNATGDGYSYGMVTAHDDGKSESNRNNNSGNSGMAISNYRYTCDIAGKEYTCTINYGSQFKNGNAVGILLSGNSVVKMKSLHKVSSSVSAVNEGSIIAGGKEYKLSDKVAVYKVSQGSTRSLTVLPLSELKNNISQYSVSASYDKLESKGGRIRVLVAIPR